MEFEEKYRNAIFRELAKFCLDKVNFTEQIEVKASINLLVDDVTEYQYTLDQLVTMETREEVFVSHKSVESQTDIDMFPEELDNYNTSTIGQLFSQQKKRPGSKKKDGAVLDYEADTVQYTHSDEQDTHCYDKLNNDGGSQGIMEVIPSSPEEAEVCEESNKNCSLETCPLCPAKFKEKIQAEKHLKDKHDIGNSYTCTVCWSVCPSNTALLQHTQDMHNQSSTDADTARKPEGSYVKRRRRKSVAKKVENKKCENVKNSDKDTEVFKAGSERLVSADGVSASSRVTRQTYNKQRNLKMSTKSFKYLMSQAKARKDRKSVGVAKCGDCGKLYKSKRALRRHIGSKHELKSHRCDICGKSFTGKESLNHHKRGIHSNEKPYKCEKCSSSFNFSHSLKLHLLKHSGQRPFQCSHCGKTYLTSNHLKIHVQAIHGEKKGFSCKICNKKFSYLTSLKMHCLTHEDKRPYQCGQCNKGFVNSQALKYHTQAQHSGGQVHQCDVCGKNYKTEFLMKTHRRRHTSDGTRYMCDICGRQFMYKSTLDVHTTVHNEEKSFTCSVCGKSFKTYATLYSHQYVHKTDSPYKCPLCGKAFKTKERCKAHERRHSGLKPFDCAMCGRCFPDKGGLSKHLKSVHNPVKKFVCNVCGKACSRADNLRVHMKIHDKSNSESIATTNDRQADILYDPPLQIDLSSMVKNCMDHSYHSYQNNSATKQQKSKTVTQSLLSESAGNSVAVSQPNRNQTLTETPYAGNQLASDPIGANNLLLLASGATGDTFLPLEASSTNQITANLPQSQQVSTTEHTLQVIPQNLPSLSTIGTGTSHTQNISLHSTAMSIPQATIAPHPGAAAQPYMYAWPPYGPHLYGPGTNMPTLQHGTNTFYQ